MLDQRHKAHITLMEHTKTHNSPAAKGLGAQTTKLTVCTCSQPDDIFHPSDFVHQSADSVYVSLSY